MRSIKFICRKSNATSTAMVVSLVHTKEASNEQFSMNNQFYVVFSHFQSNICNNTDILLGLTAKQKKRKSPLTRC